MSTLIFSYLNSSTLTTNITNSSTYSASTANNTLLTTYQSNADVSGILGSIISQLQANTTTLNSNSSNNLVLIYKKIKTLVDSYSITSYSGPETARLPVILQFYNYTYNAYNSAGAISTRDTFASNNPTNKLYTIWKQIDNCIKAFSTVTGTSVTVNFGTITNTTATTALNSLQNIFAIYSSMFELDVLKMYAYALRTSTVTASGVTINSSQDYFNGNTSILPGIKFSFGAVAGSETFMTSGLSTTYPTVPIDYNMTQPGLVYTYTNAPLPTTTGTSGAHTFTLTTTLSVATIKNTFIVYLNDVTGVAIGDYVALDGTYDATGTGTNLGGPKINIFEYSYITAVDTTNKTITIYTSISKNHMDGSTAQIFRKQDPWFSPLPGMTLKKYSIVTTTQSGGDIYLDYIQSVSTGDWYMFNNLNECSMYKTSNVQIVTTTSTQTQFSQLQGVGGTNPINRLVAIYSEPSEMATHSTLNYNLLGRTSSSTLTTSNSSLVFLTSLCSSSGVSPLLVGSYVIIDSGSSKEIKQISSISNYSQQSVTITFTENFKFTHNPYVMVQAFQAYTNDSTGAWATASYNYPYLVTPLNSSLIHSTIITSSIPIGTTVIPLASLNNIAVGQYCSIDTYGNNEIRGRITAIDSVNKTITLRYPTTKTKNTKALVIIYWFPSAIIPADATYKNMNTFWQPTTGLRTFTTGETELIINDTTSMEVGDIAMIDTGAKLEYCTILSVGGSLYLSVDTLKTDHSNKIPIQVFSYPVKVPYGSKTKNIVTTTNSLSIGQTTINVSSASYLTVGTLLYLEPSTSNYEITVITAISGTTCTVTPLKYGHAVGTTCIAFLFYRTPNNSIYKNWSYLSASASNPNTVVTLTNVSNISVGDYLQFEIVATLIEVTKVVNINTSTKQVTISNPLMFSHSVNCVVQIFNMTIPTIPSDGNILAMSYIYSNISAGGTSASVYNSNVNITNAKFMIYSPSTSTETGFITTISGGNTVNLSTSLTYAHTAYDLVVLFSHPITFPASVFNKNIFTTLVNAVSIGNTLITVENSQNIVANNVISIMNGSTQEYKLVKNVSGNVLTVSPPFTTSRNINSGIAIGAVGRLGVSGSGVTPGKDDYPLLSSTNVFLGYYSTPSTTFSGSYIYSVTDISPFQLGQYVGWARRVNNNSQSIGTQQIIGINNTTNQIICFPQLNSTTDSSFILFQDNSIFNPNSFSFFTTIVSNITSGSTTCVVPYGGASCFTKNASSCDYVPLPNTPTGGTSAITVNNTRILVGTEDKLITNYNGGTGVITVDTPFQNNYTSGYPNGVSITGYYPKYENVIPSPTINIYKTQCVLVASSASGQNTLTLNSISGIEVGQSVSYYSTLKYSSSGVTNQTVSSINTTTKVITLSANNTATRDLYNVVLFYVAPPSVPIGGIKIGQTSVNETSTIGSTTIKVSSVTSISVGNYLLIGYGTNQQQDVQVMEINSTTNTLRLDTALLYAYNVKDPCQFYRYATLPTGSILLSRTTLTANASTPSTSFNVTSSTGFSVGSTILISNFGGTSTETKTISSITGNTITVNSALTKSFITADCLIQSYILNPPSLPTDSTLLASTIIKNNSSINATSLVIGNSSTSIANGTYAYIGNTNSTIDNKLITNVNNTTKTITFSSGLTYTHNASELVRIYKYPDLPLGGTLLSTSNFVAPSAVGDNTIYITSTEGIVSDISYIMTGSGNSLEQNIKISSFTSNSITLASSLLYTHDIGSLLQVYKYPDLPPDTVSIGFSISTSSISPGDTTIQVNSTSGIFAGNTALQLGYGSVLEYGFVVTSINGNTITLSSPIQYTHPYGTILQLYTFVELPTGSTFISLSTLTSNSSVGSNTCSVLSISGILAGHTYMAIGSGSVYESDMLITSVNSSNNTLTLDTSFQYERIQNLPVLFYSYSSLPVQSAPINIQSQSYRINIKRVGSSSSSGQNTLILNNVNDIKVGDYIHIGSGSSARTKLITQINGNTVTLDSPLTFNYSSNSPIQTYNYNIPQVPSQTYSITSTRLSRGTLVGETTIDILSSGSINVGDRILLDVGGWVETKIIIGINGNTLTLNTPLIYEHINFSIVQPFYYFLPSLPNGVNELPRTLLTNTSLASSNTLTLSTSTNAVLGNFLLIDAGSNSETKLIISVSGNVVTLDSLLEFNHDSYTTVQIYSITPPSLPTYAIEKTSTNSRLSSSVLEASTQLNISTTITGITSGCYVYIDVGSLREICLISKISGNTIDLELPVLYSHRKGTLVQFFEPVKPKDSILIDNLVVYNIIQENKTVNNGLLSTPGSNDTLLETFQGFITQLTSMTGTLYEDVVILLTPIVNIIESKCLFGLNTYPTVSVYIPYFNKLILRSYSLVNINNYDLRPNVYALWHLLILMRDTLIPHVLTNVVTTTDELVTCIQNFYNIYDQLHLLRLGLDNYLNKNGINGYNIETNLNNTTFPSIPNTTYSTGLMVGAAINSINEAGTVYKIVPMLKNTQFVTVVTSSTAPTESGSTRIEVPLNTGVNLQQQIIIDIGLAQEIRTVIGYGSLIVDTELEYSHPPNTIVSGIVTATNINFIIPEFSNDLRLTNDITTSSALQTLPTSTFNASGSIGLSFLRSVFLIGTNDVESFITSILTSNYSERVAYYVNSSDWNDNDYSNPRIRLSDLSCSEGHYNPSTYTSIPNPALSVLQISTLCYYAFNIKDSAVLVKNKNDVADNINRLFSQYIWNNKFGSQLWTQDYNRNPNDTLNVQQEPNGPQIQYTPNTDLRTDPDNPNAKFIPDNNTSGSLTKTLFYQLARVDLQRLRGLKPHTLKDVYYFPFIGGDTITFKIKLPFSRNNILSLFNTQNGGNLTQIISNLNTRFNNAETEHLDYNSYTINLYIVDDLIE
jgi:hypothetical protein